MKNTPYTLALCAAAALAAAAASADLAFAYHGKLVLKNGQTISTKVPMMIEFRLFRNARPGETKPLWGRTAPVRFDEGGTFYLELSDACGTAVDGAEHKELADALAAVGHADVWLSLKPAGYGELLPRKRMGILHRAEYASVASRADRLEAPLLKANAIKMEVCEIGGAFTVTNSFVSGGGSISNIVDGTTSTSVGAPGGTVLVTETFDCWRTKTGVFGAVATPIVRNDVVCVYNTNSGYGAFSLPVREGLSISDLPNHVVYMFMVQNIANSNINPLN